MATLFVHIKFFPTCSIPLLKYKLSNFLPHKPYYCFITCENERAIPQRQCNTNAFLLAKDLSFCSSVAFHTPTHTSCTKHLNRKLHCSWLVISGKEILTSGSFPSLTGTICLSSATYSFFCIRLTLSRKTSIVTRNGCIVQGSSSLPSLTLSK